MSSSSEPPTHLERRLSAPGQDSLVTAWWSLRSLRRLTGGGGICSARLKVNLSTRRWHPRRPGWFCGTGMTRQACPWYDYAMAPLQTTCVLTCPECSYAQTLEMPADACAFFHECASCGIMLRPKAGDCCVYCSYGSVPCPSVQAGIADCRNELKSVRLALWGESFIRDEIIRAAGCVIQARLLARSETTLRQRPMSRPTPEPGCTGDHS